KLLPAQEAAYLLLAGRLDLYRSRHDEITASSAKKASRPRLLIEQKQSKSLHPRTRTRIARLDPPYPVLDHVCSRRHCVDTRPCRIGRAWLSSASATGRRQSSVLTPLQIIVTGRFRLRVRLTQRGPRGRPHRRQSGRDRGLPSLGC